jgi:hypothetical protein
LLERAADYSGALRHYNLARDLDAMPMRCPSDFVQGYFKAARRHPAALLVDSPVLLRKLTAHGILSDFEFHDGHHPTLLGYIALAQDLLNQLYARGAFGLPRDRSAPVIDPYECAAHFGMDVEKWARVCLNSASFYVRSATMRYDPAERTAKGARYEQAAEEIRSGQRPESLGIPGLGLPPLPAKAEAQGKTTPVPG